MSPSVRVAGGRSAEIRPFRDEDEDGVVELYRDVWTAEFATTMRSAWRWKYREHPDGDGGPRCLVLAGDDGVIGFLGVLPARLEFDGTTARGAWFADLMVAPQARGRAGLALARAMLEREPVALGSAGPTIQRFWAKMTGRSDITVARMTRVRRAFGARGIALRAAGALTRGGRVAPAPRRTGVHVVEADVPRLAGDGAWVLRAAEGIAAQPHRDLAFLRWRFVDCPIARHRIVIAEDGAGPRGYLVLRVDRSPALVMDGRAAHDDPATWGALLRAALEIARAEGADGVEALSPPVGGLHDALSATGFDPPVRRTSAFCVIGRSDDPAVAAGLFDRPVPLLLTLADSDFGMQ